MANTVIRIKKSGVSGNVPGSLALGELALNYTDGLLYFANSTGITSFSANALSNTGNLITTTGSAQLLFPNKVTVSYTGFAGSQNASFVTSGSNTKGGIGYVDFLQANNLSAGANNTNKWFRLDSNGQFQIINSAYTTNIFNLNDSGVLTVPSFQNITLLPGGGGAITFADGTTQYSANASSGGGTTDTFARTQANSAYGQANVAFNQANAAFAKANTGSGLVYTANTTPPASGNNKGDQWYNTTTNVMYEWATDGTSYFWIDTSSPTVSNTANVNIVTTGNVNTNVVFANTVVANVNSTIIYSNTISVLGNVNANIIFANTITANYLSSTNISTSGITNTGNLTTGNLTVTGSANFVTNSNSSLSMTINNVLETVNLQTTVGQTLVNYYVAQQSIMLNTTPATANMTLNITGHPSGAKLNTLLGVGQSITVAYGFTNGATTGYYINQLQIDGTNITPRYLGGNSQTGGDPSAVDMYTWTIIKTASTPTYNVFASNTKYA